MADTKPSAFTADSTPDDADIIPYIDLDGGGAGTHLNKKITFTELTAYLEARGRQNNASVAQQTWAAAEAYLTGSYVTIPAGRLQAKSKYMCRFYVAKTSVAGTATPIINVKLGTAGTTSDTTRAALTFAAQTAVADDGRIDVEVNFRTVGSGTSAVIRAQGTLDHRLAATGLSTANTSITGTTSAGFDSTVASLGIGISVTWGTSFVGTTDLVQAELINLA
jgi:hypothetical protein